MLQLVQLTSNVTVVYVIAALVIIGMAASIFSRGKWWIIAIIIICSGHMREYVHPHACTQIK